MRTVRCPRLSFAVRCASTYSSRGHSATPWIDRRMLLYGLGRGLWYSNARTTGRSRVTLHVSKKENK